MALNSRFLFRLYVSGVVGCLLIALVFNLILGYGFVDGTGPGPFHGPASPLNGVARGEYGLSDALILVTVTYFLPYVFGWTIVFVVGLIVMALVRWIAGASQGN